MLRKALSLLASATFIALLASPAFADADLKKGKRVFNKCKACHNLDKKQNKIGPHLVGVFGRKAGTVEKFKYSSAMKKSDIVWDEKSIDAYLKEPKKFIPGNKMTFVGLKKEDDRENVIAYIKKESSEK